MPWTGEFIDLLRSDRRSLVFRLEVHAVHAATGFALGHSPPGQELILASAPGYGASSHVWTEQLQIGRAIRVSGSRLDIGAWRVSVGGWSVELAGDLDIFRTRCPRGALCSLYAGGVGWDSSRFQRIAFGTFTVCTSEGTRRGVQHVAHFSGPAGVLMHRIASSYSTVALFHDAGGNTTLASDYTAGDATVSVASAAPFDRQSSGVGVLKITPASGDPAFYLKWDGLSGTVIDINPAGAVVFGTPRAFSATGSTVEHVAYLYGHPFDLVRKILLSNNGSTIGAGYNLYPSAWSIRLPDDFVDISDIDAWESAIQVASGIYAWEYLQADTVGNAWSWLSDLLSEAGMWVTMRQGALTMRAAQNPFNPVVSPTLHIHESDVVGAWSFEDYDQATASEQGRASASTAIDHATGGESKTIRFNTRVRTTPVSDADQTWDLSDRVFDSVIRADMQADLLNRLDPWAFEIAERLRVDLGLEWARLTAGDLVSVTLPVWGRTTLTRYGYDSQPCLVVSVEPDFSSGVCRVELATIEA